MADYKSIFTGGEIDGRLTAVAQLQAAITALEAAISAKYTKPSNGIPSSDLDADVNTALAKALTAVQDLSGYYTKDEVDALLAAVQSQEFVEVTSLPTASASTLGKIYLVGPSGGEYDRYITTLNNGTYAWLQIGSTQMDLSGYAKAEDVPPTEKAIVSKNILAPELILAHSKYIRRTDGEVSSSGGYGYTDFIELKEPGLYCNNVLPTSGQNPAGIIRYDANKNLLGYKGTNEIIAADYPTTKYVRINFGDPAAFAEGGALEGQDYAIYRSTTAQPYDEYKEAAQVISDGIKDGAVTKEKLADTVWSRRKFRIVFNMRPNDAGTAFEAQASGSMLESFFIPVAKGTRIRLTASESQARTCRMVFSHTPPANGVLIDKYVYASTKLVSEEVVAPYDGFFTFFHYRSYFADQTVETDEACFAGRITLEGGGITDGVPDVYTASRLDYMRQFRTPKYIKARRIFQQNLASGETLTVCCYGEGFNYLGSVTQPNALIDGTVWVKLVFSQEGEYPGGKQVVVYGVNDSGDFETACNGQPEWQGYLGNNIPFSFEVQLPQDSGVVNERHFDNGSIRLPLNYTPDGDPVPLAIFWHGTDGFNFSDPKLSYADQMQFLLDNGYAVCDCSGMSDKYRIGEDRSASNDSRFTPVALACFSALYTQVTRNFNVRKDGVFLFGKSNGGLGVLWLATMRPFPIKAAAILAGSLSTPESMRYSNANDLNYWCDRFGMSGYTYDYVNFYYQHETAEGNAYIIDNTEKWRKWDPLTMMSDVDTEALAEAMFASGYLNQDQPAIWAIVNAGHRTLPTPLKIWHAVDDASVPIQIPRFLKKMVDNTNGMLILREIPAGYGGHHAVDNSNLAPTVTVQTKFAGEQTIVQAYAELVDWFDTWN